MLREIGIFDAYGVGFEFRPQEFVDERNDLTTYYEHQTGELAPGQYSDDTQMSIATSLYLLQMADDVYDSESLARTYIDIFKRDPRKGYSKRFQSLLEEVTSPIDFLTRIENYGKGDSNGAAMRSCPIGLHSSKEFVKKFAKFQAELTHSGTGVLAAQAAALSVYYFKSLMGLPSDLPKFLNRELGTDLTWLWAGGRVAGKSHLGLSTVCAAIDSVITTRTHTECLKKAVGFGGDTDSVAAIAGGISSVNVFHENDITENLIRDFEPNGAYGYDYLGFLDLELKVKFNVYNRKQHYEQQRILGLE